MKTPFSSQLGQTIAAAPAAGSYTMSDADNGRVIELTGACTVNIPTTLTASFLSCFLMQMDANASTIVAAGGVTLVSDSGQNATVAGAQYAMYELRRTRGGVVLLRSGA